MAGVAAAAWPGGAVAAPACTAKLAPAEESAMRDLIAAERQAARAPKVRNHRALLRAGRSKSVKMARGARFAHSRDAMPWAKGRAGGQNLALASTVQEAFTAMLHSAPHRANMIARDWRFAAVGAARSCNGLLYFTVNFMGPPARA